MQITNERLDAMISIQEGIAEDATRESGTIHTLDSEILSALKELKEYRDIGPTPEQLKEVDRMYMEKCMEVDGFKKQMIKDIKNGIKASNTKHDNYMTGIRNGMRWCLALLGIEPEFEKCNPWIPAGEMPEDMKPVIVWFEYFRYGDYNRPYQTYGLSYAYNGEWSEFVNGQSGWKDLKILEWMPLPGREEETDDD